MVKPCASRYATVSLLLRLRPRPNEDEGNAPYIETFATLIGSIPAEVRGLHTPAENVENFIVQMLRRNGGRLPLAILGQDEQLQALRKGVAANLKKFISRRRNLALRQIGGSPENPVCEVFYAGHQGNGQHTVL